ncbi:hypothetical protein [Haladaptatus sp. CMAA 1911]|uniref:hypothetical protein n=1 Tax=unclassified Haladaptatus TaxID=2622732 RepID=UPI0037545BC6
MSSQETDQEVWEDPFDRTDIHFIEFLFSDPVLKMLSWVVIGSVFVTLAAVRLLGRYRVPIELLFFLFLGQGFFFIGFHYLTRATASSDWQRLVASKR